MRTERECADGVIVVIPALRSKILKERGSARRLTVRHREKLALRSRSYIHDMYVFPSVRWHRQALTPKSQHHPIAFGVSLEGKLATSSGIAQPILLPPEPKFRSDKDKLENANTNTAVSLHPPPLPPQPPPRTRPGPSTSST